MCRIKNLIMIMCAASMWFGCSTEEVPMPSQPGTEEGGNNGDNEPDKEVTNPLTMCAAIRSMEDGSRANIVTAWQPGHTMGLYTDGNNLSYTYNGNEWMAKTPYQVDKEQEVFAYYPYSEEKPKDGYVEFDLTKQDDALWGKTTVTPDFPQAKLEMEHTMCLIRVKLLRDEYMGVGKVEKVVFGNVPETAMFGVTTGSSYIPNTARRTDLQTGGSFMLNDENPVVSELIIPATNPEDYSCRFTVDGKELVYNFPSTHFWRSGNMYTYTIKIKGEYNTEINLDDVTIDVEYWEQLGKTDDIVWKYPDNNGKPGIRDKEDRFTIATNHTNYGYDTYQNEGKPFGLFYYHKGTPGTFEGKLRFVLMQNDRIVEKFQPIDFTMKGNWGGKAIQCYVTSAPGTYQLVPLFQRKGESTWFKAFTYNSGSSDDQWMYEIQPPASDDLPSLRQIYLESAGKNLDGLVYPVPFNKEFGVVYTLSNKGEKALKGKIKATWEREFKLKSNSYRPDTKKQNTTNDNEWNEVIGMADIDIPAGARFWKNIIPCKITTWYDQPMSSNNVGYAGPILHLYYQAEGTTEWKLLRIDSYPLLQQDHEQSSIWDETQNNIMIYLEEW